MEKRVFPRIKSSFPVELRVESFLNGNSVILAKGEIVNISNTGVCVVSDEYLDMNTKSEVNLQIADYRGFEKSNETEGISVNAKVAWIKKPLDSTFKYRYGLEFEEPHNQCVEILKKALFYDEEKLLNSLWNNLKLTINFPAVPLSSKILSKLSPTALSIDVTNLCNLKCNHCFWDSYKYELPEQTNKGLIASVKAVLERYPTITNLTWYGGEPLINVDTINIIKEGIKLRKNNLVITNGTFPFPVWSNRTHFAVSIDGTEEIHNKLRGADIYDKIKRNIIFAISKEIPVAILYCINPSNIDCISDFLEEWADKGTIGIVFTVYAPIRGKILQGLNSMQRDKVVSLLLEMKKKYKKLIWNTETMIELLRDKYGKVLAKNCLMNVFNRKARIYSIHMCNDSFIRVPCALGRYADCLHCRSVTKLALYSAIVLRDRRSLLSLLGMYHSKPHCREKSILLANL